ncbi:MAG: LptF/LptG family permease [Acidobacteriota bacterium]
MPRFVFARSVIAEVLPTFAMATGISTFLLLIQALFRLADLFVSRDVTTGDAVRLLVLTLPHVLVLTIPIGMLFASLMVSARLSGDSELIALQAAGVRPSRLAHPVALAGLVLFVADALLTLQVMPDANRSLERLRMRIALSGAKAAVDPRVFIEDFPGRLLYVDNMDRDAGMWSGVLLFDLTSSIEERLVVARTGELVTDARDGSAWLNLEDAATHILQPDKPEKYRRNFNQELAISLAPPAATSARIRPGARSTSTAELLRRIGAATPTERLEATVEFHKRLAIPAATLVLALIGFPLGARNRRGGKGYGLTASVALVVVYYVLLNNGELLAHSGTVPPWLGVWMSNLVFLAIGAVLLARLARRTALGGTPSWWWQRAAESWRATRLLVLPWLRTRPSRSHSRGRGRDAENGCRDACAPPLVSTFDRYLLSQCLLFFVLVLVAVSAIYVVVNLTDDIDDIRKHAVPLAVVATHYLFMLPMILHDILPIAFLIAFLGTAAVLERANETTALKAAGVPLTRIAMPLLLSAALLGLGLYVLDESVAQRSNRALQRTNDIIKGRSGAMASRATDRPWVFLPDGRTLVNFLQFDQDRETLLRPAVYVFDDELNLRARFSAERAVYREGRWLGEGAWSRTFPLVADQTPDYVRYLEAVELPLDVRPSYFGREYRKPSQMSFSDLSNYVSSLQAAGYRVDRQLVQLHLKVAYPISVVVLAWLALPYAFRMGRHGTVMGVALALVLGAAYFAVMALVTKLGETSLLPPIVAAWTPTVVFGLLALNRHTTLRT